MTHPPEHDDIHRRIRAEFTEMPGLKLTLPQAARLFSLDRALCEQVLGALVQDGALAVSAGAFARPDTGRRHT
jgi:hypothetical protein